MSHFRLRWLLRGGLALGVLPSLCDAGPASPGAQVFGIATLSIDPAKADQFPRYLRAARASHSQRGVELVGSYQLQFGEDTTRVVIWSARDAETLRRALGEQEVFVPSLRGIVQSETVEVAEQNAVGPFALHPDNDAREGAGKVFAVVWVSINASEHANFVKALQGVPRLLAKHGVDLVASYHIQLGNMAREVDIWGASDAETLRRGFYAPDTDVPAFSSIIKSERVDLGELVSTATTLVGSQARPTSAEAQQAVAASEQTWLQSLRTNNPDRLAPLLSDQMVSTAVDGQVTGKAASLAEVQGYKWRSLEYSEMHISVFGSTAIANYISKGTGADPAGKPFSEKERWTDTWVKLPDGRWQCVAAHSSNVEP